MKTVFRGVSILSPLCLLSVAGLFCLSPLTAQFSREGPYWVQNSSGSFSAPSSGRLRIESRGPVTIRGGSATGISYLLKKRVRARGEAEAQRLMSEMNLSSRVKGDWNLLILSSPDNESSPELQLKVPSSLKEVLLETHGGGVEIYDISGKVDAHTGGGRIQMDRIGADVKARTGGGEIHLGRAGGTVRCLSGGGSIRVASAGGECWFETAGGEISIGNALGPVHATTAGGNIHVDRAASSVSARTAGGLIEVLQAAGLVTAETSGGSIQVGTAKSVRCNSASGAIRLKSVSGSLRASTANGSILAELVAGTRLEDSTLSTGGGDIIVLIPSNFAVSIQAQNAGSGSGGRILSDFGEIRIMAAGTPRGTPTLAEGALNGGGPVLRISAIGGTIYLRRQK